MKLLHFQNCVDYCEEYYKLSDFEEVIAVNYTESDYGLNNPGEPMLNLSLPMTTTTVPFNVTEDHACKEVCSNLRKMISVKNNRDSGLLIKPGTHLNIRDCRM